MRAGLEGWRGRVDLGMGFTRPMASLKNVWGQAFRSFLNRKPLPIIPHSIRRRGYHRIYINAVVAGGGSEWTG